ncbi:MAG: glycosyltransferase [Candidatus Aenigmarchaeota archaeon]|nr:glycosyltransferase [Candidatus Aenigmarchaeota archaeon]
MKFSFIIPAYNEEKFLGRCIKSIKAQNRRDCEIIVSYSPSRDKTLKIAKKHRVKIVTIPKSFPGKARNAGASVAKGAYLVFVDADTVLPENFLGSTVEYLDNGYTAIAYRSHWIEREKWLDIIGEAVINPVSKITKLFAFCFTIKNSVFRASGGFDEGKEVSEDWDLSQKVKKFGKTAFATNTIVKVSARRYLKFGKIRAMAMYFSWFLLGYVLRQKVKYFHLSDVGSRRPKKQ